MRKHCNIIINRNKSGKPLANKDDIHRLTNVQKNKTEIKNSRFSSMFFFCVCANNRLSYVRFVPSVSANVHMCGALQIQII